MNCARAERLIRKELVGDATSEERERLAAHAAECGRCSQLRQSLLYTADTLGQARPEPPAADRDLTPAVMARIAGEANVPAADRSRISEILASRPAQAVGAVAATVLCALMLWLAAPSGQALAMLLAGMPPGY